MRRLVRTRDVDEARLAFSRLYAESTLDPLRGPFDCTLDVAAFGGINVVTGSWSGGARTVVPVLGERYVLSCSAGGVLDGDCIGEPFAITSGRSAAVFSPGMGATFQIGPGFQGRTFTIERAALEEHFRALTGRELRGPLRFDTSLAIDDGPGLTIVELAQAFRRESERQGASPLLISALRDALFTSLLTNAQHSASTLLATPPRRVAPGCVRRAEEYIDAHAAEPITLADIAGAAGVSARSLQSAFKAHRGTTPMDRLRSRRLELARQRLIGADAGTTVAAVLATLGLDPGRFSVLYKKRFGESPSETLRRAHMQ